MAQIALYGFDIITGTNGGNGVRMSQIMEPGIGSTNGSSKLLEFPIDCRLGQWKAQRVSKYQMCAQPRVCSLTGGNPVYPRPNQPDISESWDGISNGA